MPNKTTNSKKKTLGITLGGGGARGLVHIGILDVLEKAGIQASCVTGTSMGAIIGAAYTLGMSPEKMKEKAMSFGKNKLTKLSNLNFFHESLIKADSIDKALHSIFQNHTFNDCKIPLRILATNIESGKPVILKEGYLKTALQASSAIPFIFSPVFYDGCVLVDGGLVNSMPIDTLQEFKPDVVMGVKINNFSTRQEIAGDIFNHYYAPRLRRFIKPLSFHKQIGENIHFMIDIILRSLEISTGSKTNMLIKDVKPDLLLDPDIQVGLLHFEKAEELIEEGRRIMTAELPKLKKLLQ